MQLFNQDWREAPSRNLGVIKSVLRLFSCDWPQVLKKLKDCALYFCLCNDIIIEWCNEDFILRKNANKVITNIQSRWKFLHFFVFLNILFKKKNLFHLKNPKQHFSIGIKGNFQPSYPSSAFIHFFGLLQSSPLEPVLPSPPISPLIRNFFPITVFISNLPFLFANMLSYPFSTFSTLSQLFFSKPRCHSEETGLEPRSSVLVWSWIRSQLQFLRTQWHFFK